MGNSYTASIPPTTYGSQVRPDVQPEGILQSSPQLPFAGASQLPTQSPGLQGRNAAYAPQAPFAPPVKPMAGLSASYVPPVHPIAGLSASFVPPVGGQPIILPPIQGPPVMGQLPQSQQQQPFSMPASAGLPQQMQPAQPQMQIPVADSGVQMGYALTTDEMQEYQMLKARFYDDDDYQPHSDNQQPYGYGPQQTPYGYGQQPYGSASQYGYGGSGYGMDARRKKKGFC